MGFGPAPPRFSLKSFPFHAGRSDTRRVARAISAARRAAHFVSFHYHVIRSPWAVAAHSPGARAQGVQPCDPDPAAGHPDRADRPRPPGHRPDRHRQDRRLHAALDPPAPPAAPTAPAAPAGPPGPAGPPPPGPRTAGPGQAPPLHAPLDRPARPVKKAPRAARLPVA